MLFGERVKQLRGGEHKATRPRRPLTSLPAQRRGGGTALLRGGGWSALPHSRELDRTSREHDDFGADRRAIVQIDHIFVAHANAAGGHVMADSVGLIGAVNAVERVDLALPQIECARAERIIGPAMHAVT